MLEAIAFPPSLQRLVAQLSKLPSIGRKSAQRLAYHLVSNDPKLIDALIIAMQESKSKVRHCEKCFFITEQPICAVCRSNARDRALLCVVEKPVDVISIERAGEYRGVYHVLHGLWAPLKGQGPESMKFKELIERVKAEGIKEVILALNATVEGDATSLYVAKALKEHGVEVSRLAHGLPKGGELEYADDMTLSYAFSGRKVVGL